MLEQHVQGTAHTQGSQTSHQTRAVSALLLLLHIHWLLLLVVPTLLGRVSLLVTTLRRVPLLVSTLLVATAVLLIVSSQETSILGVLVVVGLALGSVPVVVAGPVGRSAGRRSVVILGHDGLQKNCWLERRFIRGVRGVVCRRGSPNSWNSQPRSLSCEKQGRHG